MKKVPKQITSFEHREIQHKAHFSWNDVSKNVIKRFIWREIKIDSTVQPLILRDKEFFHIAYRSEMGGCIRLHKFITERDFFEEYMKTEKGKKKAIREFL